jgi:hypothetical protein
MLLQQYSNKFKENQTTTISSTMSSSSTTTSTAKSDIELPVLAEEAIKALMQHMQHISSSDTQEFIESQAKLNEFVKELEEEVKKCRDQN